MFTVYSKNGVPLIDPEEVIGCQLIGKAKTLDEAQYLCDHVNEIEKQKREQMLVARKTRVKILGENGRVTSRITQILKKGQEVFVAVRYLGKLYMLGKPSEVLARLETPYDVTKLEEISSENCYYRRS